MNIVAGGTLSHYQLIEEVGGGGQGTVFKARDLRLGREVALKVLPEDALQSPEARRRFQKEARALSLLSHPNIQVIHDFDTENGIDFLVSEFIPGQTLKETLLGNGTLSETELARLGLQIAEGLACAHEHGVVHRDLSAKNLILSAQGHLKIVDFGLARFVQVPSDTASTETMTASIAGTLPYMSPEQLSGLADARSDIYGIGALLYQMATGRLPFAGLEGAVLVAAIHTQPPPPPSKYNSRLSTRMEEVLLKCLEKDPERRYQSARELAVDLKRVLQPWPVPPIRRHRVLWTAVALLLVIAGVLTGIKMKALPIGKGDHPFDHPEMAAVVTWPGKEQASRISPDGTWISFLANRSGKPTLWRRHVSGGEPEAITTESGNILSQTWSPDGLEIAYLNFINGEVFLKFQNAFGGPASRVIPVSVKYKDARIVRWIGAGLYFDVPRSGLWRWDANAGKETAVMTCASPSGRREQFDVSADEKNVAYVMLEGSQSSVWVSNLDGSDPRRISAGGHGGSAPRWSGPNGLMYVSEQGGQPDIWFQKRNGGKARQITFSTAAEDLEDVARDGSLVTFTLESESGGLWRLNLNGAERGYQVTPGSPVDFWPIRAGGMLVFQKLKPGMEGASTLFNNGIYLAPVTATNISDASRLMVERGAFPLPSPGGRFITFIREPTSRGWELWLHDLSGDHDRLLCDDFLSPDLFMQPLSLLGVNEAWSVTGDTLFAVGLMDRTPVLRRFVIRSEPEPPSVLYTAQPGETLSDLFPSGDGLHLAFLAGTSGEAKQWKIHVRHLRSGADEILLNEEADEFQSLLLRGWLDRDRLLAVRVHINPDWTHRLEFIEVGRNGSRLLGRADNAFGGTVQIDPWSKAIDFIRLDEPGGAPNIYAFDPARNRMTRLTDNRSPSITFAGMDISRDRTVLYSMVDHNQDIWMVQFKNDKHS